MVRVYSVNTTAVEASIEDIYAFPGFVNKNNSKIERFGPGCTGFRPRFTGLRPDFTGFIPGFRPGFTGFKTWFYRF